MCFRKKKILTVFLLFFIITISACVPSYKNDNTIDIKYTTQNNLIDDSVSKQNELFVIDTPDSVGMDTNVLNNIPVSFKESSIQSLLIMKDQKLVYEEYFNNATKDSQNRIYSITKSFTSALIGIAIDNGYIDNTEIKISQYFPEYFKDSNNIKREKITIEHLLTMTPGFIEEFMDFRTSFYSDVINYTLNLPINYEPGEKFQYANSASHLLSVIIGKATGENADAFATKHLFNELDIKEYSWVIDSLGNNIGCSELYLKSRDMLKFGMLYLQEGSWNGKQLISKNWINESTIKKVDTDGSSVGKDNIGYGYQWWQNTAGGYDYYTAAGYGGQFICVLKELDLIVVVTAMSPETAGNLKEPNIGEILEKIILPALQ